MADVIRIETDGATGLARTQAWLSRHRGQSIDLDRTRQLEFGVPISGAGAVLVAVTVGDGESRPQLGGVVRAIATRGEGEVIRLVFEGRSPAHLEPDDAQSMAVDLLAVISRLVEEDDLTEEVA
jgi:hypothetical protein